ncbi:MAG: hypothetical protein ABIR37_04835 [Candidatus Saccharimonadales bacterium]
MTWETPPQGPAPRGPRPTKDLGRRALHGELDAFDTYSVLSDEEVDAMNYAGHLLHSAAEAELHEDNNTANLSASKAGKEIDISGPKETIDELIARTIYPVTRTPLST